ncbi:MAG: zf-HC2 domain-containing protein [Acidobacteriota bacterium]
MKDPGDSAVADSDGVSDPCGATKRDAAEGAHDEITCQKLILDCLLDYESGAMPEDDRRHLERHLEACPPCGQFLTSYRATGKTLQMLRPCEVPAALARAVVAFVRSRSGRG